MATLRLDTLGRLFHERRASSGRFYERSVFHRPDAPFHAVLLTVPATRVTLEVHINEDALRFDFTTDTTRRDLPGRYRSRPGFYLAEELRRRRDEGREAVLFNGNNIGYWANQFAVRSGRLVQKVAGGAILSVDDPARDYDGRYPFLCQTDGIRLRDIDLVRREPAGLEIAPPQPRLGAALSGFPLLRAGATVAMNHMDAAWDPRLLYGVGSLSGVGRREVQRILDTYRRANAEFTRHSITCVGIDADGTLVVLVVELSERSRGASVIEAADLLAELGVRDAIALGAAGDAQLATTAEGFLTRPFVAGYDRSAARRVRAGLRTSSLAGGVRAARPVPSYVTLTPR